MFEIKNDAPVVETDNEYDSLFYWDEIVIEDILENEEEILELYDAMTKIDTFLTEMEKKGKLIITDEE